jgi:hypothetical protein
MTCFLSRRFLPFFVVAGEAFSDAGALFPEANMGIDDS